LCISSGLGCLAGASVDGDAATELPTASESAETAELIVYEVSKGRIEIRPRLKYEIAISLHVLKFAEDHHQLFVPWAQRMRKDLSEQTLRDATVLIENTHEWQLCSLVQEYDGTDTIEALVEFVRGDDERAITEWASTKGRGVIKALGLTPDQFPGWYADFLNRYYDEAFEKQWLSEHRELVFEDAESVAEELEFLELSPTAFMEELTGRRFTGSAKIILYPSSFSRPQHAYGFSERGHKVAVYKIGGGRKGVLGTIFHELLHPLIRGWREAERMKQPISELARQPLFRIGWELRGRGSYDYPTGWLEELIVHAVSTYISHEAGMYTEEAARRHSYGNYENALYDAIFDRYDTFDRVDDFILYAITHIKVFEEGTDAYFAYSTDGVTPFAKPQIGPVKAIARDKKSVILVVPTHEDDKTVQDKIHAYVEAVRDRFFNGSPIVTDSEALKRDLSANSIIVYGTATGNLWLAKHFTELPVRITSDRVVADTVYAGTDLRFITAWPNPQNSRKGVVIYTAQRAEDVIGINSVFHGPTDYVVAEGTEVLGAGDYDKQNEPWTF
jgi:hypothetical protein